MIRLIAEANGQFALDRLSSCYTSSNCSRTNFHKEKGDLEDRQKKGSTRVGLTALLRCIDILFVFFFLLSEDTFSFFAMRKSPLRLRQASLFLYPISIPKMEKK